MNATDLSASPTDLNHVLAIDAESGRLVLSVDGAKTWSLVEDAPQLRRVHWRTNQVVGITAAGELYTAGRPDSQWLEIGDLDVEPVAFTTSGEEWWIVTENAAVLYSDDGANNFKSIYEPPARPGT